jgi:hypothetical protein
VHRQPVYLKLGYGDVSLPIAEKAATEILSLPMYPELRPEQIDYVADTIKEAALRDQKRRSSGAAMGSIMKTSHVLAFLITFLTSFL